MGYMALALLLLGITFLLIEIFVPGFGVFGISGLLAVFFSAAITIVYIENGVVIVITGVIILVAAGYFAVELAKRYGWYGKLILKDTLNEDENNKGELEHLIDRKGVVKTPLRPNGKVDFDGVLTEAYSDGDFLSIGQSVTAYKVYENKLYVKKAE